MSCFQVRIDDPGPLYIRLCHDESSGYLRINNWDPTPHGGPGPVEINNTVHIGDALISINRTSLVGSDFKESILTIKAASKPRVLTFYRDSTLNNSSSSPTFKSLEQPLGEKSPRVMSLHGLHHRHILSASIINESELRRLACGGLPDDAASSRAVVWRLLLQYLPWPRLAWHDSMNSQRALYQQFIREFTTCEGRPMQSGIDAF